MFKNNQTQRIYLNTHVIAQRSVFVYDTCTSYMCTGCTSYTIHHIVHALTCEDGRRTYMYTVRLTHKFTP